MIKKESEEIEVTVKLGDISLKGSLGLAQKSRNVVIFSHGSGSSRNSPRNKFVAHQLRLAGIGTLLFDLLTEDEDAKHSSRFDIALLTNRLVAATQWLMAQYKGQAIHIGYFGASTGSAAAFRAAAELPEAVSAIVSRGGRPDLASDFLPLVKASSLLIVGGFDQQVIELNRLAYEQLLCEKRLVIVPGATHLFEEPGTLEQVAQLAAKWFDRYLNPKR